MNFTITTDYRFRVISDDAVRVVNSDGLPVAWAYFLPRDALHKYRNRGGLWCSFTRNVLTLSRPLSAVAGTLDGIGPAIRLRWPDVTADQLRLVDAEIAKARNLAAGISLDQLVDEDEAADR